MSVLQSKSSGRVLLSHLQAFCQRSRIKQSWSVVAMLPKIYSLCQVTFFFFFFFSLRLILKQLNLKPPPLSPLSLSEPELMAFLPNRVLSRGDVSFEGFTELRSSVLNNCIDDAQPEASPE